MDEAQRLIDSLTAAYKEVPVVDAVAIAGSRGTSGTVPDPLSDIDLYVYTRGDLSADIRRRIMVAHGGISRADPNLQLEWRHAESGIGVDVIVFDAHWMEDTVLRVVEQHLAQCARVPEHMAQDLEALFLATAMRPMNAAARSGVMAAIHRLLDGLDRVLVDSGLRLPA